VFKTAANAAPAVSVAPRSSERLSARREVPKNPASRVCIVASLFL